MNDSVERCFFLSSSFSASNVIVFRRNGENAHPETGWLDLASTHSSLALIDLRSWASVSILAQLGVLVSFL